MDFPLLENGEYDFEVIYAMEGVTKASEDKIDLRLQIYNENRKFLVFDVVSLGRLEHFRNFCESIGISDSFEKREVNPGECYRSGKALIGTEKAKSDLYKDKNYVVEYRVGAETLISTDSVVDDDIPF